MSTLYGGGGNDSYGGSSGADSLYGGGGNDSLYGGGGDDTLTGGSGFDLVDGGIGNDILLGGQGNDTFYGGDGADEIIGDGQWFNPSNYSSNLLGLPTTLTVVNNADGPIDLWYLDVWGQQQFVRTLAAGETYSFGTLTSSNYFLEDADGYYLDVIRGTFSQTFSYNPPLNDLIYGGSGADTILGQYGADTIYGGSDADAIFGGYGSDHIDGGTGGDVIFGGDGNDIAFGGEGDDYVEMGVGNDTFGSWGTEAGNDTVYGGTGADSLNGGGGDDQIFGGDGGDWISGASGQDTLYGGAGRDVFAVTDDHDGDTIYGGETGDDYDRLVFANYATTQGVDVTFTGAEAGSYSFQGTAGQGVFSEIEQVEATIYADTIDASAAGGGVHVYGLAGDDSIAGSAGNDTIYFGSGNDTVFSGDGNDFIDDVDGYSELGDNLLDGGAGADTIWAGDGADTVFGGAGADILFGEDGNDLIFGGANDDYVSGDAGNDTLSGGSGADTLVGGAGADVFVLAVADTGDLIADFEMTLDAGRTLDQLDVSDVESAPGQPVKAWDVTVTDDGSGNARLGFPMGESITLTGVSPAKAQAAGALQAMGVPCFVQGSRILTPHGPVPIKDLAVGDLVLTAGGRAEPILWHGIRRVTAARLAAAPHLRPIRLRPRADGQARALKLSRQHGVFLAAAPGLLRAAHLAAFSDLAHVVKADRDVIYHHILLPKHSVIRAEGWLVESFYPGPQALAALMTADRFALAQAIGIGQATGDPAAHYGTRVLPLLSRKAAQNWLQDRQFVQDNGIVTSKAAQLLHSFIPPAQKAPAGLQPIRLQIGPIRAASSGKSGAICPIDRHSTCKP